MSRTRTRARKSRARLILAHAQKEVRRANFEAEFQELLRRLWSSPNSSVRIEATENLLKLISQIVASDVPLWPFKDLLFSGDAFSELGHEEREEIEAIFAQAVAPNLAGMTSGAVHLRRNLSEAIS